MLACMIAWRGVARRGEAEGGEDIGREMELNGTALMGRGLLFPSCIWTEKRTGRQTHRGTVHRDKASHLSAAQYSTVRTRQGNECHPSPQGQRLETRYRDAYRSDIMQYSVSCMHTCMVEESTTLSCKSPSHPGLAGNEREFEAETECDHERWVVTLYVHETLHV
jgi:hypothetical protein